jgi:hypothetical protein
MMKNCKETKRALKILKESAAVIPHAISAIPKDDVEHQVLFAKELSFADFSREAATLLLKARVCAVKTNNLKQKNAMLKTVFYSLCRSVISLAEGREFRLVADILSEMSYTIKRIPFWPDNIRAHEVMCQKMACIAHKWAEKGWISEVTRMASAVLWALNLPHDKFFSPYADVVSELLDTVIELCKRNRLHEASIVVSSIQKAWRSSNGPQDLLDNLGTKIDQCAAILLNKQALREAQKIKDLLK